MHAKTAHPQRQERKQIRAAECLRLEYRLHHGDVHERELYCKRDRYGREQHFVLCEAASKSPILDGGDEVQEDKAGEGLQLEVKMRNILEMENGSSPWSAHAETCGRPTARRSR